MITEKNNPIIIIDDDDEDIQLISEAIRELNVENELLCFKSGNSALSFLKKSDLQPLFILCDVNMHLLTGFELKQILHDDELLRLRSVPFLFLSTSGHRKDIHTAYDLSVQGYFRKPNSFEEIVTMMKCIIEYWTYCQHPNTFGLRDDSLV